MAAHGLIGAGAIASGPDQTLRVGQVEVSAQGRPDFDVAADAAHRTLYFVYLASEGVKQGGMLQFTSSGDGGRSWTAPESFTSGVYPHIKVDRKGTVHLVFERWLQLSDPVSRNVGRIWYASRPQGGGWTEPIELESSSSATLQLICPRIAVDGNDNVHILFQKLFYVEDPGPPDGDWKVFQRALYTRKPPGKGSFEPIQEFQYNKTGPGGGGHGDITADSHGDIHIVFQGWSLAEEHSGARARSTRLIRHKDGSWAPQVDNFGVLANDCGLSIQVDSRGVLHAGGFQADGKTSPHHPLFWVYFNNSANPAVLERVKNIPQADWEVFPNLLAAPNGDVYLTQSNNIQRPLSASKFIKYEAATRTWGEPTNVSPPNYVNASVYRYTAAGQAPRMVTFEGKSRMFYPERAPGQPFRFYQRIFAGADGAEEILPVVRAANRSRRGRRR